MSDWNTELYRRKRADPVKNMTKGQIERMLYLATHVGYNPEGKKEFRRLSVKFLKEVRTALGIDADIRFKPGEPAVPGDAILHGDDIYIEVGGNGISDWILYRTCEGRQDYTGRHDNEFSFDRLREEGVPGLVRAIGFLRIEDRLQYGKLVSVIPFDAGNESLDVGAKTNTTPPKTAAEKVRPKG